MRYRIFVFFAGLQALFAGIYILSLPADIKNQFLLGYSAFRLILFFIFFILALCGMLFAFIRVGQWSEKLEKFFAAHPAWLHGVENCLFGAAWVGFCLWICPLLKPIAGFNAIHQRLTPALAWFTLVCIEGAIFFLFESGRQDNHLKWSLIGKELKRHWIGNSFEDSASQPSLKISVWEILFLLLVILFPANQISIFSGLPLSTAWDGLSLFLIIPVLINRDLRERFAGWINQWSGNKFRLFYYSLLIGALLLKSILLFSNQDQGFLACYQGLSRPVPNGVCELSFENPTFRNQVTRLDPKLSFDQDNWNLSFLNSFGFDYLRLTDNIDRKRIPFDVRWTGEVDIPENLDLAIEYIGEGKVTIGDQSVSLDPFYSDIARADLNLKAGYYPVLIQYRFDDQYRIGHGSIPGPYAIFRTNLYRDNSFVGSLEASQPALPWQMIRVMMDICVGLLLCGLLLYYLRCLLPAWRGILVSALLSFTIYCGLPELSFMGLMGITLIWLLFWKGQHKTLMAYIITGILLWWRVLIYLPTPSYNLLRFEGTDMLVYEEFARRIFETGSLQAGEDIFYFQAFFRYIVYFLHLLFGESDMLRSWFVLLALNMGIWLNANAFYGILKQTPKILHWLGVIFFASIVVLSNSSLVFLIQHGISEVASWIFLLFSFYLLLTCQGGKGWFLAANLTGMAIINRFNHLPALAFLWIYFCWPELRKRKLLIVGCGITIFSWMLLIPLHNWVYGHQLVLMPTSADATVNLILPPEKLFNLLIDPSVLAQVISQVKLMFGLVSIKMLDVGIPIFILFVSWLVLGLYLTFKWKERTYDRMRWLWLLPLGYLGVQFFFYMIANYPRHLFAGYLSMALVGMYIAWNIQAVRKEV